MECPCCKHELSFEEFFSILNNREINYFYISQNTTKRNYVKLSISTDINISLTFSLYCVLKNQESFHAGISSLLIN